VFHPYAGVLSAYGMGLADVTWNGEADLGRELLADAPLAQARAVYAELEARGRAALAAQGFAEEASDVFRRIDLRYRGTETALTLELDACEPLRSAFEALHTRRFGYARSGHPIEVHAARVEVCGRQAIGVDPAAPAPIPASVPRHTRLFAEAAFHDGVPVLAREELGSGARLEGPALVLESTGAIAVDPGFALSVDASGRILLEDRAGRAARDAVDTRVDPVQLEIFNNLFMSIAEQMGTVLRQTALSTNIRERLDFSCAVFDAQGGLVANAPHIPVHLGAMGETVRAVHTRHPRPERGDVFASNDPAAGGSHLPDITVVTPVHVGEAGELCFFTASRGHHADVGGITPGSMPPFSASLAEEGIVLSALPIVRRGRLEEATILASLASGPHPARNPRENLADLEAQIAANRAGARLLEQLVERYGLETVRAYMGHVQDNAAARVGEAIAKLPDGVHEFADALDDGTPIHVALDVRGDRLRIDFAGTGGEIDGNLNAPRAVTYAAVIYVLRALVGEPIPLNSGCLRNVEVVIPEGSLLSPSPWRAVAGGNVETSTRVVDTLLGALGKLAACQGTMNNLTFGNARFGYYETIGGGAGAGPGFAGASGVHTHMTNTRITDPEVLEARFPVRLLRFGLREGSGGAGHHAGGDGLIRELEFLEPMQVSILSERRERAPFGLAEGEPGQRGRNLLNDRELGGKVAFGVGPGDRVRIETPGGGGFGTPGS